MQTLVANFTVLMVVGLVIVLVVSRLHRGIGGLIGVIVWAFSGFVGNAGYDMGGGIALAGFKLPREGFLGLVGVLILINLSTLIRWLKSRRA